MHTSRVALQKDECMSYISR